MRDAPVPFVYKAGWAPGLLWMLGEETNLSPLPGLEPRILGSLRPGLVLY